MLELIKKAQKNFMLKVEISKLECETKFIVVFADLEYERFARNDLKEQLPSFADVVKSNSDLVQKIDPCNEFK